MKEYYKAYKLSALRNYPKWSELNNGLILSDDEIVYLRDDLIVIKNPFKTVEVIFEDKTGDWKSFCEEKLDFKVPKT